MDTFLGIIESTQTYMHKVPIWDFLKVDCLEYLAMPKYQKIAAIKKYVHPIKNLDTGLNDEFTITNRKLLFLLFFASASSHFFVTLETFNHGQCFTILASGWCEWYTVSIFLNKVEIGTFSFICLAQTMTSSLLQKSNLMLVSKKATNRDTSLKTQLLLLTENKN